VIIAPPTSPDGTCVVVSLEAPAAAAQRIASLLAESFDPEDIACGAFEQPNGSWLVEAYFPAMPDVTAVRDLVALAAGDNDGDKLAASLTVGTVEAKDWVRSSLEGLKPVHAGRFVVHGAHDRDKVPPSAIGIEIEAALAFGTGHHGTTRGCLEMLDYLARSRSPERVLDLGTGSGVLAIAAAKLWRRPILATDIDLGSVVAARGNARLNGVCPLVECVHAAGFDAPQIKARGPFDLVFANILLAPLKRLAAPMGQAIPPGANVILSGLMVSHASAALAAYRTQGLTLERRIDREGWTTMLLSARSLSWT